jgi:hypothetical protein
MPAPEPTWHTTDYGEGVHPLVETCRTLAVVLALGEDGTITGPDLQALSAFVPAFDAWFRQTCGLAEGKDRLHLLYQRELVIATAVPPRSWAALRPLAQACSEAGMAMSLTLDLEAAADDLPALATLIADGGLRGICIALPPAPPLSASLQQALALLVASSLTLSFTGPVQTLLDSGLLDQAAWNARHIGIDPLRASAAAGRIMDHDPCWRRLRLVIDQQGHLYPCFGLLGLAAARLGHITEPLAHSVLGGRASQLDLPALARSGPSLGGLAVPIDPDLGLPPVCAQHRAALQAAPSPC